MMMMMMMTMIIIIIIIITSRVRLSEVVTDLISDYLCESINGVTENINVAFLGTTEREKKGDSPATSILTHMTYVIRCLTHIYIVYHCFGCGMVASENLALQVAEAAAITSD